MDFYDKNFKVGILGGGQLGRMFIQEAINYNVQVSILDPNPDAPCSKVAHEFVCGDFKDFDTVFNFGKDKNVVTIEIEHVNTDALKALQREGVKVFPQPEVLEKIKDKGTQKLFYQTHNLPTASFELVEDKAQISPFRAEFPYMQKARVGGYDGKGVTPLRNDADMEKAFDCPSVLEKMVDFEKELSVIVARNESGEISTFPVVELEFNSEANLVDFLLCPANVTPEIEQKAQEVAIQTAEAFGIVGLLAVELFLTKDGEVLINEVAPRPHNSGHQTIEGNVTSQFEQYMRAILNLPLGSTAILRPSVMVNLLGEKDEDGAARYLGMNEVMRLSEVYVHLYGKTETKPFRKMGHVTITADRIEEGYKKAKEVKALLKVVSC